MWLENSYSAILNMYLQKYHQLKIHIGRDGKITKTEKEENGNWLPDRNLRKILNQLPSNISSSKNLIIILKQ